MPETVIVKKKPWWKSKTVWVNVLGGVTLFAGAPFVPPLTAGYIIAGANLILRIIAKEPIETPKVVSKLVGK